MTLTEDNDQPNWFSPDDPHGELAKLVARRDLLVRALRETQDAEARADLAYQLRVASQQIEAISWASDGEPTTSDDPYPPAAVTADLPSSGLPTDFDPNGVDPGEATPTEQFQDGAGTDQMGPSAAELAGTNGVSRQPLTGPLPQHGLSDPTFAETMAEALSGELPPAQDEYPNETVEQDQRATADHGWDDRPTEQEPANEPGRYAWPEPVARPGAAPVNQEPPQEHTDAGDADHRYQDRRYEDPQYQDQGQQYQDQQHHGQEQQYQDLDYQDQQYQDRDYQDQQYQDQDHHGQDQQYQDDESVGDHQPQSVVDAVSSVDPTPWPIPAPGGNDRSGGGNRNMTPRHAPITDATAGPVSRNGFVRPSGPVLAVVGVSLALLAGVLWLGDSRQSDDQAGESIAPASPQAAPLSDGEGEMVLTNIRAVLQGLGLGSVTAELRDGVVHLVGAVPSQADYDSASAAARTVADTYPIDMSALTIDGTGSATPVEAPAEVDERAKSLQTELDRILAATPLIFGPGLATLTELHQRILNNAVIALQAYPGFTVTIAGFTDDQGDEAQNRQLSLSRAENVKAYLVGQGLPDESFEIEARGEDTASGSSGLAGLERRVELEVQGTAQPAGPQETIRIAIVAPSASNDLAFTQSMVDAVNLLATERSIEVAVTDNTFVPDDAAAAVSGYAEQGFDLVIAHGSQFGSALLEIAPQHPDTAFAWGTASDTLGQPNIYAYDAAAQEGGYVLGAMAGLLSQSSVIGVVGPIEVGDAAQYVRGFEAGARTEASGSDVRVTYTGSFSDIGLASEAAQAHLGAGADVLTGSAQMVVGAIAAAEQPGALWFGTQANQAPLAPNIVVASQVYHWEVALRQILDDVAAGTLAGRTYTADLANGGLVIEYNPDYPLSPEVRQRADELSAAIANGSVTPPS